MPMRITLTKQKAIEAVIVVGIVIAFLILLIEVPKMTEENRKIIGSMLIIGIIGIATIYGALREYNKRRKQKKLDQYA